MKQDIASPLSGTYKAANSSLVYTKAEGCSLFALEFSRKSRRNKPLKSNFTACKLSDFLENSRALSISPDTQQVTELESSACLLSKESHLSITHNLKMDKCNRLIVSKSKVPYRLY